MRDERAPLLPDWLSAGLPRAEAYAQVVAHRAYRIDALTVDPPTLILPLTGAKRDDLVAVRAHDR